MLILVAIGANLPGRHGEHPVVTCKAASEALRTLPGLRLTGVSNWYLTEPVPPSAQSHYVNGAVRLQGESPNHLKPPASLRVDLTYATAPP